MKETKAFYRTSEFWLMVLGQLVLTLQTSGALDLVAQRYSWISPILQVVLASSYITSRGKAKSGVPSPTEEPTGIEEFTQPGTNVGEPGTTIVTESSPGS